MPTWSVEQLEVERSEEEGDAGAARSTPGDGGAAGRSAASEDERVPAQMGEDPGTLEPD